MGNRNFESVLKVRVPTLLVERLKYAASSRARTVSDVMREAVVNELASLGTPYTPSNDNGETPPYAA